MTGWRLTLDMSGGWKRAKHAGRRPLDGRVRRLMEHGLFANHECQFATPDLRETGCFEPHELSNQRTPTRNSKNAEAGKARAKGWCRSRQTTNARRCGCARPPNRASGPTRRLEPQPQRLSTTREHGAEHNSGEAGNERHETHPFASRSGSPPAAGRAAAADASGPPRSRTSALRRCASRGGAMHACTLRMPLPACEPPNVRHERHA